MTTLWLKHLLNGELSLAVSAIVAMLRADTLNGSTDND